MVFTRSKLSELSKEELIEELLSFDNFSEKINELTKKMDNFASKFDRVFSELQISKTCDSLGAGWFVWSKLWSPFLIFSKSTNID